MTFPTMDHKIILRCRVCLDEYDEETMLDLFQESVPIGIKSKERNLQLNKKVEYCCGVKIRDSPDMPTKICIKCFEITRIWYNFRQMCINSQVYLESLCADRKQPKGCDDDFYEYLLEDLQSFRAKAYDKELIVNDSTEDGSAIDSNDDSEMKDQSFYVDGFPFEEAETDSGLENAIVNIKVEKNDIESNGSHANGNATCIKSKQTINDTRRNSKVAKLKSRPINSLSKKVQGKKGIFRPPSPSTYMCSICGNVYNKKASFLYHMSLHTNIKPHQCELCAKSFRQLCELKNHMRRHTGEKPYKCSYCDRHFIDRSEKHRHERVHTNTRPYKCNVCGKSFMYSAILKNHSKLHTGKKDFSCMVCQKDFTLQHQLKAHLLTLIHKQKEEQFVSAGYEVVYE